MVGLVLVAGLACAVGGVETPTLPPVGPVPLGPQPTVTLLPTSTGAATVPPVPTPASVVFEPGAISSTQFGVVSPAGPTVYLVNVQTGQRMSVTLRPQIGNLIALGISAPDGSVLLDSALGLVTWTGSLTAAGDYTLTVTLLSDEPARFLLDVVIPPPNAEAPGTCEVTAVDGGVALYESTYTAETFGTAVAGDVTLAHVKTADGWIGFDPGVAQAGNQGRARMRWYPPGTNLTFNPQGCDLTLELVLSMAMLENGTYFVFGLQDVQLVNGSYTDPAFSQGTPGHSIHDTFMGSVRAFGDMNGDGLEDAAFTLASNTGGTGTFVEIVVVLNNGGNPQAVPGLQVGDREPVTSMFIENGVLTAGVTVHGPNDGFCCPSVQETWTITLQGGALVKAP